MSFVKFAIIVAIVAIIAGCSTGKESTVDHRAVAAYYYYYGHYWDYPMYWRYYWSVPHWRHHYIFIVPPRITPPKEYRERHGSTR